MESKVVAPEDIDPSNLTAERHVLDPKIKDIAHRRPNIQEPAHPWHPPSVLGRGEQDPDVARDKPPTPKRVVEYEHLTAEWLHEIQPGRYVVAVLSEGVIEGTVITRDQALCTVEVKSGGRCEVKLTDVYKIKR